MIFQRIEEIFNISIKILNNRGIYRVKRLKKIVLHKNHDIIRRGKIKGGTFYEE